MKTIKPPAILVFDFDGTIERYEYPDLTDRHRGTQHEYIRRDLIDKIIHCAIGLYVAGQDYTNNQVIDIIIGQDEQNQ